MKAILLADEDVTLNDLPPEYVNKLGFVRRKGRQLPVAIFPKGTEFEGPHALHLVSTGQAMPSDDECKAACGMTPGQLARNSRAYSAAANGIGGEKDLAMFLAGAIDGYGPGSTDENPVYIHGPNWKAWQEAATEVAQSAKADTL